MTAFQIIAIINFFLAILLFFECIFYFLVVKSVWRWIKLMYAINSALVAWFIYNSVFLDSTNMAMHWTIVTLLLVTLQGGIIVSFAKLNAQLKANGMKLKDLMKLAF